MKQSVGEEEEIWPFPPPGTGALTTCKTLFNLNPLINISNHASPSSEGEKENISLALAHFLTAGKKE